MLDIAVSVMDSDTLECVQVCLPEGRAEFERAHSRCGKSQRVPVCHLLNRSVETLDIVSLQHQH